MPASLTFLGAAQTVTGSRHLFTANEHRVLIDCGLNQERNLQARNWDPFPIPPRDIDAVILTHGHLDHCGWLPRLCAKGFRGRVHCTNATAGIAPLVMADAAQLQEEDARTKEKRHAAEGRRRPDGYQPLYTRADAEEATRRLTPTTWGRKVDIAPGISATFHPAGHILGSAVVRVQSAEAAVLFSGDLGPGGNPLVDGPATDVGADNLVVESTYGDREHEPVDLETRLATVLDEAWKRGGNLIIPAFAIERSQELLYYLRHLHKTGRMAPWRVFVDSPMAIGVLDVFKRNPDACAPLVRDMLKSGESPFDLPGLTLCADREQSKTINDIERGALIIAGSGMCTGGRIKHHLLRNMGRPECTLLFVGYQASGTLGRQLLELRGRTTTSPPPMVRLFGRQQAVRCVIDQASGFSAHAGKSQILSWISRITPQPKRAFVVHGSEHTSQNFAAELAQKTGWQVVAPTYGQEIAL